MLSICKLDEFMSLEKSNYWSHVINYLSDSISADEELELFEWLEEHADYRREFNQYKQLWDSSQRESIDFSNDVDNEWNLLSQKINLEQKPISINIDKDNSKMLWIKVAASILFVIGISYLLIPNFFNNINNSSIVLSEISTSEASTSSVDLPDNTQIVLKENTKVNYPQVFSSEQRVVYLEGEAYFDVTSDPNCPFIVYAGETRIKVVGTSFYVNCRDNDEEIEVIVFEGEVEISSIKQPETKISIRKNEKGSFNKLSQNLIKINNSKHNQELNSVPNKNQKNIENKAKKDNKKKEKENSIPKF